MQKTSQNRMKIAAAVIAALSSYVFAVPTAESYGGVKPSDWRPKGPNDVRSPCPGINSFANHGFLPHNGKDLTMPILKKAFKDAVNVGPDFAEFAGKMGFQLSTRKNKKSFNLDDLNVHNAIEHDASLSRQDAYFGNFHNFNETIFKTKTIKYFQDEVINVEHMAELRMARMKDSKKRNPEYSLSKKHREAAFTEAALIISLFGDPQTGVVKHPEYVRYWFQNRKLPYELGWHPRMHETNLTTLQKMVNKIRAVTPKEFKGPDEEFVFRVH